MPPQDQSTGNAPGPEAASASLQNLDQWPAKVVGILYSLLPTPALLALRTCSKVRTQVDSPPHACPHRPTPKTNLGFTHPPHTPTSPPPHPTPHTQGHLARFQSGVHWEPVSQRLVVELHASRLRLETASEVCGMPPTPALDEDGEGNHDPDTPAPHPVPPRRLVPRPLAVGHRGACGHMTGNSLASFHHAVRLGADMIELDVCIDRSGDLVVHHDLYLSDGRLLETLTLPEIKTVAPEVEPLSIVLRELRASGVTLYLDLKTDRVVAPLMRLLHEAISKGGWTAQRLLIASFNQYDMIEVNAHRLAYPSTLAGVETCIIVDGVPLHFARQYEALGVKWCSIGNGCVLPSFLEDAHTRSIGVMVWTVNNPSMMRRYLDLGVDALVTDFPERFVAVRLKEEEEQQQAAAVALAAAAAAAAAASSSGGREEEKAGSSSGCSKEEEDMAQAEHPKPPHPHHHHHKSQHSKTQDGTSSPLMSAYPTPLHQPRKRLVTALREALPLLRALEGRSGNGGGGCATHPPTAQDPLSLASNEEKRSKLSSSQGKETREGEGLMLHLKKAAKQAEESATAVLQPRLPKRRPVDTPQTPPSRVEEEKGMGGKGEGKASSVRAATHAGTLVTPCGGKKGEKDEEAMHDWPFLSFERTWAQSTPKN